MRGYIGKISHFQQWCLSFPACYNASPTSVASVDEVIVLTKSYYWCIFIAEGQVEREGCVDIDTKA